MFIIYCIFVVLFQCTAEDAYKYTNGRVIFASGSPFPPVEYMGKTYYPGQGNNSYIFPGVALGVICAGASTIPEDIFLVSAERLANLVTDADLDVGSLYPPLDTIRDCSVKIAIEVMNYAYKNGLYPISMTKKSIQLSNIIIVTLTLVIIFYFMYRIG